MSVPTYITYKMKHSQRNLGTYLSMQAKEIIEHKYYISEREGRDVGIEYAAMDWIESGHAVRFHDNYMRRAETIEEALLGLTAYRNIESLDMKVIHELLQD